MSEFLFKLIMGKQLDKMKDLATAGSGGDEKTTVADVEDPEVAEARLEAEQKREAKYAKMEMKREVMRQQVRDKYNITKPENVTIAFPPPCEGRITTPKNIIPPGLPDDDEDFDPVQKVSDIFKSIKSIFQR
ncbi:hypothetical protein ACOME3_004921 [Neoechinorhynchus agilis]